MRYALLSAAAILSLTIASSTAQVIGCLSGAAAGALAGHMAGHGILGAVGGCIAGHQWHRISRTTCDVGSNLTPITKIRGKISNVRVPLAQWSGLGAGADR
jgi:fructose-specific phosphotransferase system IIC component